MLLGILHFVFCLLFFTLYFSSSDPERSLGFVLFLPIDPWIVPLTYVASSEIIVAIIITILGTAQWWLIGWLISQGYRRLLKKQKGDFNP